MPSICFNHLDKLLRIFFTSVLALHCEVRAQFITRGNRSSREVKRGKRERINDQKFKWSDKVLICSERLMALWLTSCRPHVAYVNSIAFPGHLIKRNALEIGPCAAMKMPDCSAHISLILLIKGRWRLMRQKLPTSVVLTLLIIVNFLIIFLSNHADAIFGAYARFSGPRRRFKEIRWTVDGRINGRKFTGTDNSNLMHFYCI